jgi:hypothetical protein
MTTAGSSTNENTLHLVKSNNDENMILKQEDEFQCKQETTNGSGTALNVENDNIHYSINPSEPDRMISVKHMNSRSRSKYRMLD